MAHVWRKKYKSRNRILDKFYTKQEVVKRCLDEVNKLPYLYDCVIEPSAGDAAFCDRPHPKGRGFRDFCGSFHAINDRCFL